MSPATNNPAPGSLHGARARLHDKALVMACWDTAVSFHDVDPAGIVWHGNYCRFFEHAREELMRKIDYDYARMRESGYVWPVVDTRIRYLHPARYPQAIRVWAGLTEWQNHMKIEYEILDVAEGTRLTVGHTIQCAVTHDNWELQLASPPQFLACLEPWLP